MSDGPETTELLATIPLGALLSRLLRLLVSSDRHDEFVGDLIEQVNRDLADSPRLHIGLWLWGQTLHSAPALLALRLRRLGRRATMDSSQSAVASRRASSRHDQHFPGLLIGTRATARSWPVPAVVSVSAHAIGLFVLVIWMVGRVEEVEAPSVPVVLSRMLFAPAAPAAAEPAAPQQPPSKLHRRPRTLARATIAPPTPEFDPAPQPRSVRLVGPGEDDSPPRIECRLGKEPVIALPPTVAEKRCLSCPPPRLPPAFVRFGVEQQMIVKTCVAASGDVTSVDVLRGVDARVDARIVDTVRGWRFSPHSVDRRPVPFCYPTRFIFTMN